MRTLREIKLIVRNLHFRRNTDHSLLKFLICHTKSIESETESFIHGKGDSYATLPEDRMEEPSGGELTFPQKYRSQPP